MDFLLPDFEKNRKEQFMEKIEITSWTIEELTEYLKTLGEKPFRARQIYEWLHQKLVMDFSKMTNISKTLQQTLEKNCSIACPVPVEILCSKIDGTRKYLFRLWDGNVIESVLMRYSHGISVCISTQVGCRMGCRFCASTLDGWERNLTPGEMLGQIYQIQKEVGERISHIVLMGSGEPMDNYENVVKFLHMISDENGLHISPRNITISTCGLVEAIKQLATEKLPVTLALSLHASDDSTRKELMPVANRYTIAQVLEACDYFFEQTGRRITFEYSLVLGVNDTGEKAEALACLLRDRNCHVNLIPVNPIKERNYRQSDKKSIERFKNKLEEYGVNATVRREMGRDIQGACGQLRKSYMQKNERK